jgi:hypothetical protein
MKVIFLDIDGVMNSQVFYHERHKKRMLTFGFWVNWIKGKVRYVLNGFKPTVYSFKNYKPNPKHFEFDYTFKRLVEETDAKKWKWLSEWCNAYDIKICISSVWKNHFKDISDWNKALIKLGFNGDIFVGITGNRKTERGIEIKEWIDSNNKESSENYFWHGSIEKYAIIDDDSDMLPEQMDSFFLVDGYYGLTPNILYRIKRHMDK